MNLFWKLQAEGHRVLLFSHSKILLNIIEEILLNECAEHDSKYNYMRIDGDT